MNQAIIFDLDGTLWDSTGEVYRIWNNVFSHHAEIKLRVSQDEVAALAGKTMEEIAAMLFPELDQPARKQLIDECGEEEVSYLSAHGGILYDGVRETIDALRTEHELYIVSNCQKGYIEAFLHAHRFERDFKDIEMSGRTGKSKGENIRLLMERNGVEDAVYVGDTTTDESAARFAGIPFIHAAYGFGTAVSPDRAIHSIKELPDAIT